MKKYALFALLIFLSDSISFSQNKKAMTSIVFNQQKDLIIIPSPSSTEKDFDFLTGSWNIHNRKLRSRLTHSNDWIEFDAKQEMRKVLTGMGNIENITATVDEKPYEGMAVRLFDAVTRLWSIYWADNHSGTMDAPVTGSFENNIGIFYGKEIQNGQEIVVQFKWDATDVEKPVWSQAFSIDAGKTWEWNWYMYFTKRQSNREQNLSADQPIGIMELRNYILKPGQRNNFIRLFENNFILPQQEAGSFTLGQYKIKGAEDNFFWIRGFHDMSSRNKALNEFYHGPVWKQNRTAANSMILNNDNVYLLKPLNINDSSNEGGYTFNTNWFGQERGIAVVDFYTSNTKLDQLIAFFRKTYMPLLTASGVDRTSFWVSEMALNDFPGLPVFQDKNLLVQISFYPDEFDYQEKMKLVASQLGDEQKIDIADLVTLKNTLIIYPTEGSFKIK